MMDPANDPATLLTFVTTNENGSYKINIYGTPAGLRNLAAQLLKQADVDQQPMTYLRDYDTDHTHIKPTFATAILAPSSDELQLGRLDTRAGQLAYWAQERINAAVSEKKSCDDSDETPTAE